MHAVSIRRFGHNRAGMPLRLVALLVLYCTKARISAANVSPTLMTTSGPIVGQTIDGVDVRASLAACVLTCSNALRRKSPLLCPAARVCYAIQPASGICRGFSGCRLQLHHFGLPPRFGTLHGPLHAMPQPLVPSACRPDGEAPTAAKTACSSTCSLEQRRLLLPN